MSTTTLPLPSLVPAPRHQPEHDTEDPHRRPAGPDAAHADALRVFLAERPRLFRIALRVTGDPTGAEDVVQEAWLRWQRAERDRVRNPAAFLTTTTNRLAINLIRSAAQRHETPAEVGAVERADHAPDPGVQVERAVAVEQAMALLMTSTSPAERAAYLLRKGLDYPYLEIARVLGVSTVNARQLVRRAQTGIATGRARPHDPGTRRRLVGAFLVAARTGDVSVLEDVVSEQVRRPSPTEPRAA